ncbi:MAG: hypothetical protein MPK62_12570, partial [Alphaproteobacteria bacterium]|nr:hypothetical protein [Alphaproteobacteria bacterium]
DVYKRQGLSLHPFGVGAVQSLHLPLLAWLGIACWGFPEFDTLSLASFLARLPFLLKVSCSTC